jgi:hypothetical protein
MIVYGNIYLYPLGTFRGIPWRTSSAAFACLRIFFAKNLSKDDQRNTNYW